MRKEGITGMNHMNRDGSQAHALNHGKRYKTSWVGLLPFLLTLLCIGSFILSYHFDPKSVSIPKEDFPLYGSDDQDTMNGWVYFDAVSMTPLATATFSISRYSTSTTYHNLYLAEDKRGNHLVYDDESSWRSSHGSGNENMDNQTFPKRLYGQLSTVRSAFSSYNGYETIKDYGDYDLIREYQYPAQAWRQVQTESEKTIRTILRRGSLVLLIASIICRLVLKKKEKEALYTPLNINTPNSPSA